MFIGHALLAFALVTLVADWRGWPAQQALVLGAVAGSFAALPDVDMAYAAVALDFSGLTAASLSEPSTLWGATRSVHRSMTHSLVVAMLAGPAFGLWALRQREGSIVRLAARGGSAIVLGSLTAAAYLASGLEGGIVVGLFAVAGVTIAILCRIGTDFSAKTVGLVATVALLSHPWGDLVTGSPPQLLYPFDVHLLDGRVLLHADPTVHLLGAATIELAAIWLAAVAITHTTDCSWSSFVDRRATVGVLYGIMALVMTPPTLEVSYHFVFSILLVGVVCGGLSMFPWRIPSPKELSVPREPTLSTLMVAFTTLAGTTAAFIGYVAVYALVGPVAA